MKNSASIIKNPKLEGEVGESHVWDGPIDLTSFPKGKGSSSGKNGLEVLKYPCDYKAGPITSRAK